MVTTELRYFFKNGLSEVWRAFIENQDEQKTEEIQDYYLPPAISTSCGIKYREGSLEVKSLVESLTVDNFPMQVWEKITVGPQNKPDFKKGWVQIRKKRWLFYYDQNLVKTLEPAANQLSCQVEVSEIELEGNFFHSFCLESRNEKKEGVADFLMCCLSHLKESQPTIISVLHGHHPCSYPAFLLSHTACT